MDPTANGASQPVNGQPQDGQQPKEQRILAAIVFTDVVGFSKLAAQNEARVYTALQRDMGVITSLCRAHGGQVLNTMGDGMLLCFTSAVDAMSCAVEIQRTLYSQSQTLPTTDVLYHRIGVHLGDIIMSGDNVFGDGVNIAARLQAEAKPGGICYSKTVHEIIKNKLKIDAQYMAPRQLKNIGKVEVWQVPPIEEARQKAMEALIAAPLEIKQESSGASGGRAIGLSIAAVIALAGVFFLVRMAANNIHTDPRTFNKGAANGIRQLAKNIAEKKAAASTSSTTGDTAPPASTPDKPTPPAQGELQARLEDLKKGFQFDQIVTFLQGDGKTLPDAQNQAQTFSDLSQMKAWMDGEVNAATASNPINCTITISGAPTEVSIYRAAAPGSYTIHMESGDNVVSWPQLGNPGVTAIAQALERNPITAPQSNAEKWVGEFQGQYPQ